MDAEPTIAERIEALLATLRANGSLHAERVAAAFRAVPRHYFLPSLPPEEAYRDIAIPTKFAEGGTHPISSSSQPSMMAIMLEQLDLHPGDRILEIGAGTGYNAALMAHLAGPAGHVTALDIDDDIVEAARAHLAAAGVTGVDVLASDGAQGWPAGAPYDAIMLTVGAWDIAPAWHTQLRPGGRLVLPLEVAEGAQKSLALVKPAAPRADGLWFESASLRDCGFMRLRGVMASPELVAPLGPEPGLAFHTKQAPPTTPENLYTWLRAGGRASPAGMLVTGEEVWASLSLWAGLHAPDMSGLSATHGLAERGWVPALFEYAGQQLTQHTSGLFTASGFCVLGREPGVMSPPKVEGDPPFDLYLWSFGPDPGEAEARLRQLLAGWEAAGRPSSAGLSVRVYDKAAPPPPVEANSVIVEKPNARLLLTFPARGQR